MALGLDDGTAIGVNNDDASGVAGLNFAIGSEAVRQTYADQAAMTPPGPVMEGP